MPNRIPEALRRILAEEYTDDDQLAKVLAQVFLNGGSAAFHPDGSIHLLPGMTIEFEAADSSDCKPPAETSSDDWDRLLNDPPKQTEIAVFGGNFGQGAQGKHDENTWKKDDFINTDAPIRKGHGGRGHRGGMRQANSYPVLRKLLSQSYKIRKYR